MSPRTRRFADQDVLEERIRSEVYVSRRLSFPGIIERLQKQFPGMPAASIRSVVWYMLAEGTLRLTKQFNVMLPR